MFLTPWRERTDWMRSNGELEKIQNEFNRLFNFTLNRWGDRDTGLLEGLWSPAVDVAESKDAVLVRADLPGLDPKDIDVSVKGDLLVIKGEKKYEAATNEQGLVRSERFSGSFHRALTLPAEIDPAKVQAKYTNGVLELTLPKKEEYKPKQIQIQVK